MLYTKQELRSIKKANDFSDLPNSITEEVFEELLNQRIPNHEKPFVEFDKLKHRVFDNSEFWRSIPAFKNVSREEFLDVKFQNRNTVRSLTKLEELLENVVNNSFIEDVKKGIGEAPMNLSISPYILSLIDWKSPFDDPLRIQFLPIKSGVKENHPKLKFDSLGEQNDSPVDGLVHRYKDKVLFLALDVCPVYCRFCTRSYAVGGDTNTVGKIKFDNTPKKWKGVFAYIASRPEVEDVVVSGGDAYMLAPNRLKLIGETLLNIPHVRRIRIATKGPAVMPMKILHDKSWTDTIIDIVKMGKEMGKEVVLHTHFNSANEITEITKKAMLLLFKNGVTVRNQSVLIKGVNDSVESMVHLIKKLSYMNVQPYYVYQHDMVEGTEDMRTSIAETVELEKAVRGVTAGFNTPLFVMDAPGGGGKRDVHSYEYYDKITGISIYRSPSVDKDKLYFYFDPIESLPIQGQKLWEDESVRDGLIENAIKNSGLASYSRAI